MKVKKIEYLVVDYGEVEKLISDTYFEGKEFNIPYQEELNNGSTIDVDVTGVVDSEEDFIARKKEWGGCDMYMQALARDGLIEKGRYLVNVWW